MNYIEYGKEHCEIIVLLHGGGLSWWNYREVAEQLSDDYHVILPILDGHANSGSDFVSIEENTARIISFIEERFGGSVLMLGGLSLGGQVVLEILSQKKDICRFAFIESALCIPSKLTYAMIKPAFGGCYGLIKYRWFSKLQFQSLRIKKALFEEYYRDTCGITKSNMIAFLEANALYGLKPSVGACSAKVCIFVGEKENKSMLKSAQQIHRALSNSTLQILPNMHHGEFSINYAHAYVKLVREIIQARA